MRSGSDNLNVITQHIRQAQSDLERTGRELASLTRETTTLHEELGAAYRELARIRLDDLMADRVISRLDEKDRETLAVLEKRKSEMAALKARIEESVSAQRRLETERKALAAERDEAGKLYKERVERQTGEIQASEAYREQKLRVEQAREIARLSEEKASQAERDRKEKGAPYESDALFMYLWNRRFLTPDYTGSWIAKSLDGRVAKLIDFKRNRANYHLLVEIPKRLRDHAEDAKEAAEDEAGALAELEASALDAGELPALRERLTAAESRLKSIDSQIEAEEARYADLLGQQARFNDLTDPHVATALGIQEKALKNEPLNELFWDALSTPRPEDDRAVSRIQEARKALDDRKSQMETLQALQRQQQQSLLEMETLRRRYTQEGYDAYHTSFPTDFSIAALLAQLISGALNSETVWREIGRHHRTWERRERPTISMGKRGSIRTGGFPKTRSGGFGTGGFRSGGGFGSKGGFRTGGSF